MQATGTDYSLWKRLLSAFHKLVHFLTLRKQCTRPSVHSIYFITAMTQWLQHLAKQNLLKIKTWGTSMMIEVSSDSQCRLMPSKQGSAVEGNQTQKWLLDGTSRNKHKAWVAHKRVILLRGPGLALGATIVTHELCFIQNPCGLRLLVSGSCYLGPLPGGTNEIQKFSTSEWKQRTCRCCCCWSIQAHQNHYIRPLPQNGHVQIQRR
jgi:hypothetical protein